MDDDVPSILVKIQHTDQLVEASGRPNPARCLRPLRAALADAARARPQRIYHTPGARSLYLYHGA